MSIQMKSYRRSRRFTLLEMLIAMAVLVVLAMIMFQIVDRARQAWSSMQANTRIYENARIVFDVIGRDLQSAVASREDGREIPFYVGNNNPEMLAFVSAVAHDEADSRLAQVSYGYDENEKTLKRRLIQDNDTDWNFYGQTSDSWTGGNYVDDFHSFIEGVDEITFYDAAGNEMAGWGTRNSLPSIVQVSITLFDPGLVDRLDQFDDETQERMINRTRRTFNKMIYLRAEGF